MSGSDEFDYNSEEAWSEEEEVNSDEDEEVKISNAFYEADDVKKSDPKRALELFLNVLALDKNTADQQYYFKSLNNVVILYANLANYPEMNKYHMELLEKMDSVARNDAVDAINSIIDAASKI
jgi:COP9 signalosome complex subunit 2